MMKEVKGRISTSDGFARLIANEPLVIAETGYMMKPTGKELVSWKEYQGKLAQLKELGVNALFIWAPFAHPEKASKTISCWIEDEGRPKEIKVKIESLCGTYLHVKDYLRPDPRRGSEEDFLALISEAHKQGFRVIGQFLATSATPGTFIYDEHPEWLLKTIINGNEYPAVGWPLKEINWGYVVNKAHPGLIKYVTKTVMPYWIKEWDLDGIFLDSPPMNYCPARVKEICKDFAEGYECLSPVEGTYTTDNLIKAMREKIEELKRETGKDLIFSAENFWGLPVTWSDEVLQEFCAKGVRELLWGSVHVDFSSSKYFDFMWDYSFMNILRNVCSGREYAKSSKYVEFFRRHKEGEGKFTRRDRSISNLNLLPLLETWELERPRRINCYITLNVTAPGNIVSIADWLWNDVEGEGGRPWGLDFEGNWLRDLVGGDEESWRAQLLRKWGVTCTPSEVAQKYKEEVLDPELNREWYKRTIEIKKDHRALQSENIEDALISPETKGLIAYNRWSDDGKDTVTIIVNTIDTELVCLVKTRFGENAVLCDLLSGKRLGGDPNNLRLSIPAYSSVILAKVD